MNNTLLHTFRRPRHAGGWLPRLTVVALGLGLAAALHAQTAYPLMPASTPNGTTSATSPATSGMPSGGARYGGTAYGSPTLPSATTLGPGTGLPLTGQAGAQVGTGQNLNPNLQQPPLNPDGTPLTAGQVPPAIPVPSQFQRFVKDATGKDLPVFGAQLFAAPQSYAPESNIAAPGNYVLGPGDQIQLQLWGAVDYSQLLTVDRNGQVVVPRVGALAVAGTRAEDLDKVFKAHVGKVFTNFGLSATVAQLRSIQVYVVGHAQRPGTYTLSSLSTLVNALFASGGPNANGSMRAIELRRGNRTVTQIDLYDFIARGDQSKDAALQAGDVIVIPPVGARVAVVGAFDHEAIYEIKPGQSTVGQLLGLGGGVPTLASNRKALLERIDSQATPPRQIQEIDLKAEGLKQPLRDGDLLTLLPISPAFANAVTLQGTVAQPLRYGWFEGMRLLDLIPEKEALITRDYYRRKNLLVQGLDAASAAQSGQPGLQGLQGLPGPPGTPPQPGAVPQGTPSDAVTDTVRNVRNHLDAINWDYAVIERLDRTTLTNQLITFNLGKAILQRDPASNLPLLPGDVVTIFSQNDLRVPVDRQQRLVRLEGEVAAPGVYQALPGETLPQLIRRVGGLTTQAYVFGTEFTRESVRVQQQRNLDQLISRLEASLQSQGSQQLANLSGEGAARAAALAESQRQSQQRQLARLRTLRSNGRVALEVNPQDSSLGALPGVPLEDGDRIVVPSVPGFVAAFGAVNNENVFIYRPGRTVADIFRLAGLSEDSEEDEAFVLRADGTVVANRDRSGWLSGGLRGLSLMPGDTVVVPQKVDRETRWSAIMRNAKDLTQILANLGLGLAALRSL